jgi:hypothetical protein
MSGEKVEGLISRREALWLLAGVPSLLSPAAAKAEQRERRAYLGKFRSMQDKDADAAALAWFQNPKFGFFMHYGLYSPLGPGRMGDVAGEDPACAI